MTPPLAAPSTGPASDLPLEIQRHSCRKTHSAAATVEADAGEEGRGKWVSPHHSTHRSQGLSQHQAKEQAVSLCPSRWGTVG